MEKLLTVVVPSYNAEIYLNETIPTMLHDDWNEQLEVLIVNDGSKDRTLEIANEFANKYPNTVRVIDKENGGHGSTINAGIREARGKYFKVIDADDWVDTEAFKDLMVYLGTVDTLDAIYSPYYQVFENTGKENIVRYDQVEDKAAYTLKAFLKTTNKLPDMHSIVIRTAILRDNAITIGEKMFYVDMEYIIFPLPYVEKVAYLDRPVYKYRLGTATQSVNWENFKKNRLMHQNVILRLMKYIGSVKLDADIYSMVYNRLEIMLDMQYKMFLDLADSKQAKEECMAFEAALKETVFGVNGFHRGTGIRLMGLIRSSRYATFGLVAGLYKKRKLWRK